MNDGRLDLQGVYCKTEPDRRVLEPGAEQSPKQRVAFAMVDGKATVADLLRQMGGLGITAETFQRLLDQGLIKPLAAAQQPPPPAIPAKEEKLVRHIKSRLRGMLMNTVLPDASLLIREMENCNSLAAIIGHISVCQDIVETSLKPRDAALFHSDIREMMNFVGERMQSDEDDWAL